MRGLERGRGAPSAALSCAGRAPIISPRASTFHRSGRINREGFGARRQLGAVYARSNCAPGSTRLDRTATNPSRTPPEPRPRSHRPPRRWVTRGTSPSCAPGSRARVQFGASGWGSEHTAGRRDRLGRFRPGLNLFPDANQSCGRARSQGVGSVSSSRCGRSGGRIGCCLSWLSTWESERY